MPSVGLDPFGQTGQTSAVPRARSPLENFGTGAAGGGSGAGVM
jgi:hypothetical protein